MAFKPGESGNPEGRPKGTTDRRTELRALLAPHAPELIQKLVDLALEGDTSAIKICLDKVIPNIKPTDEPVSIAEFSEAADLTAKGELVMAAVADGELTPDQGSSLQSIIAAQGRILEVNDLAERVAALEQKK